ncbi:MAG: hypothetical protein Q7S48_04415 [bacterium]|nr:hypothetical protein [bacterium]
MAVRKLTEFERFMEEDRTPAQDAALLEALKRPSKSPSPAKRAENESVADWVMRKRKESAGFQVKDDFEKVVERAKHPRVVPVHESKRKDWFGSKRYKIPVFSPVRGPLEPDQVEYVVRASEVRELAKKVDVTRQKSATDAKTPVPPQIHTPEPARAVVPPVISPERPVPPPEPPPVARPTPRPRVDRIPTPAPMPESEPAPRVDMPTPEPAARTEAAPPAPDSPEEKAQNKRAEAVKAYKEIQTLLEQARETRDAMKKLEGVFGVRERNEDEFEMLEEKLETIGYNLEDVKENYREAIEKAADLLEMGPGSLRKEIEKEVVAADAAPGAGGGRGERGIDVPPREPEEAKKWIWSKQIAKGLGGAAASILGVKFFYDGVQYIREQIANRKASAEINAIVQQMELSFTAENREEIRAGADSGNLIAKGKIRELKKKIKTLAEEGKILPERQEQLRKEIEAILTKRAKEEDAARLALSRETGKIFNDYLEKKVSKSQVAREFLNTAFVLTGMQLVRGVGMLAMGAIERTAAKLRERNLGLRGKWLESGGEEKTADVWDTFWEDTVENGVKEYLRSITTQGATEDRKDVFKRAMDFGKALGTTARFVGIGSAMYAEFEEGKVSGMLDDFLDEYNRKGPAVFADNLTRNVYQVFHLHPTGERGKETIEAPPEVKAAVIPAPIAEPEAPPIDVAQNIQNENGVIRAMVTDHKAEFVNGELVIHLGDRSRGFGEIQQALRRLIDQEIKLPTDHFQDVDADRAEKMVKMMTHLLRGETLPGHLFDKGVAIPTQADLTGIIGLNAQGDLVVHDYAQFEGVLMGKLEGAVDAYHVSMMAYVNNTGHRTHQSIMDARGSVEGQAFVADDFDASPAVHADEQRIGNLEAHAFGGKDITNVQVFDEDSVSFTRHDDGYDFEVHVNHGALDYIMASKDGALVDVIHPTISTGFEDPVGNAKLTELLKDDVAYENVSRRVRAVALTLDDGNTNTTETPKVSVPHDVRELERPINQGGLKGTDGKLHFGEFTIMPGWLDEWDDMKVSDFMEEAPARFSLARIFSTENDAHYKLAHAMDVYKANERMTVGKWVVENQKKIGDWVK